MPGEVVTPDSIDDGAALDVRPDAAYGVRASYELRLGDVIVSARVHDGRVDAAAAPLPGADCVIEAGPGIRAVMAGEITANEAIENGIVRVSGKRRLFDRFAEMFRI